MNRNRWWSGIAFALLLLAPSALHAQNTIITGTVRSQTLAPVRGALVTIESLDRSAVTNDAGVYSMLIPADQVSGQTVTVTVSQIGYRTTEVSVTLRPGVVQLDISLPEQAITLNELVVTGAVGRQERRAQPAVVSNIDAGELTQVAPITSVSNLLQSRTPGVSLSATSGTSGTAQTIRIRGASSISLSNEPLVFIDGVRADSRNTQIYGVGGQVGSRLNDLRPEDIERIEVVKGPAAATLYGADASAGVIQIITKRGRVGGGFSQSLSLEYHDIDPNWTPLTNFGVCSAAHVAPGSGRTLCEGKEAGTIVSDNPLVRNNVLRHGQMQALTWSGRGGGENYSFYVSLGADQEDGTLPSNFYDRYSGRVNFDFIPHPKVRMEADMGLMQVNTVLPQNDNNIYGYLGGGMLGSPLTVGTANDGWYGQNRFTEAIAAIDNTNKSVRTQPRISFHYNPYEWFTNRLMIGADMTRTEHWSMYPRNSKTWYGSADLNIGQVSEGRQHRDAYTIDYLGNINRQFSEDLSADFSFGGQFLATRTDLAYVTGIGLVTNAARSVDAAARRGNSGQSFSEERQLGFFGQVMLSMWDRMFLQVATRVDQHSAFGSESQNFLSPKVGVSYVVSQEPVIQNALPGFINEVRLRAAYGTTGRAPSQGALRTFDPQPYAISATATEPGVIPDNPGNSELKAERGTEFEAGIDLALFSERLGIEVTYFNKSTRDLILSRPLPPSSGFDSNPLVNIGEVVNSGIEVAANASLVTTENFGWSTRIGFNTLHNEIIDMGGVAPFGAMNRMMEGYQTGVFVSQKIKEYKDIAPDPTKPDSLVPGAVVSDDLEVIGNLLPTFEGSFSSTMNFFRNIQLYAQLDWKTDFYIYNNTDQFRERQFGQGERWVRRNEILSEQERIRRFGPFVDSKGNPVNPSSVNEAYIEPGDFLRLREVSVTYTLPRGVTTLMRASGASISLAGRNLGLWTKYSGADPEVNSATQAFGRQEFLTMPAPRRFVARLNLQF